MIDWESKIRKSIPVLKEDKFIMFRNRLSKVFRHLGKQAARQGVSCYRLYDHDLPEFPFIIEIFGDKLSVSEYRRRHGMSEEEHEEWLAGATAVMVEVLSVSQENIFFRMRQRKPGRAGQYRKIEEVNREFVVEENGLKFIVNLSDYLDTGLFLDHRVTRQRVREESKGKKVLNLFAYTGSFSVYAAAGGASEVLTVDLSNTYLEWARKNLRLNGFSDDARYPCLQADVLQFLADPPERGFDLVILDPPTFSNSKRMDEILDIQRDHVRLINQSLDLMAPGGRLYFSTNFSKFQMDTDKINGAVKDITKTTTGFDFEGRVNRVCFLVEFR